MKSSATTLKKISVASVIMMVSVFASRLIGLGRESTIAWLGGTGYGVDAYQLSFVIPEILNHLVASGFLSITFIPIFARCLSLGQEEKGNEIFSVIFNGMGLILIVFIAITMAFAPELIRILAPGMQSPATFNLAVKMTRIIIPAQFFFFTGGLFMAVQFTREKFFIPALAPLVYNTGIIIGGVSLYPLMGMEGFAWGVLGGAFAGSFLLQFFGARKTGLKFIATFNLRHPDFIRYILLTLPLMLGLTMTFSTEILMKFFGSFLGEGSISAMNYALRIMFILVGFFGQAVGMASYPFMAKLAAQNNFSRLNDIINQTLKFVFLVIPFSVLFMVLRHEIVAILFQRGAFDDAATKLTAGILPFFMAGAFAFAAQTIVSRGYFALQNTLFPALFSTGCVMAALPLIFWAMKLFGIQGLALGLSFSAGATTFLLYESWNRKTKNSGKKSVYILFLKLIPASLILGMILELVHRASIILINPETLIANFLVCLLVGTGCLILLPLLGTFFRIKEIRLLYGKIMGRILPWLKKKDPAQPGQT